MEELKILSGEIESLKNQIRDLEKSIILFDLKLKMKGAKNGKF